MRAFAIVCMLALPVGVLAQEASRPARPFTREELRRLGWHQLPASSSWTRIPPSSSAGQWSRHGGAAAESCRWCGRPGLAQNSQL